MATLASLADSDDVRALRDRCAALAKKTSAATTPAERDVLMREVLALHVSIARLRRRSFPPK
jgi:hypothetical protein